jgi:hypothetical protein
MIKVEPREHVIDAELANGNLDAWKQVLGFPEREKCIRLHCVNRGSCRLPHDWVIRLKSKKRSHSAVRQSGLPRQDRCPPKAKVTRSNRVGCATFSHFQIHQSAECPLNRFAPCSRGVPL